MGIDQYARPRTATEQVPQGGAQHFGFDVPQRDVDGRDRGHGHRPSSPIGALVKHLPDVLYVIGVAAPNEGQEVVLEVRRHGQLTAVEGAVTDPVHAVGGLDLDGDVIASWRANDDPGVRDLHVVGTWTEEPCGARQL